MKKITVISIISLILAACGSAPLKPVDTHSVLIAALIAQDIPKVLTEKHRLKVGVKNNNIISLYLLTLEDKPYQLINNSQTLINNIHHYNLHQQMILKQLLLWAYAHPIYRQETAKQVRILQRETLLVAPSNINFLGCETAAKGCANKLRTQISHIISPKDLTEVLTLMAENDPCINLSDENLAGDFGNQCLASRKGNLKVNLLSKPQFLFGQWEAILQPNK